MITSARAITLPQASATGSSNVTTILASVGARPRRRFLPTLGAHGLQNGAREDVFAVFGTPDDLCDTAAGAIDHREPYVTNSRGTERTFAWEINSNVSATVWSHAAAALRYGVRS